MSESISVPSDVKNRLDKIMKPGESYADVIEMLLLEHQEESFPCDGWAKRAQQAIAEYQRGERSLKKR